MTLLPCPCCDDKSSAIDLNLDSGEFFCRSCEQEFSREQVEEAIAAFKKWLPVLKWIDRFPADEVEAIEAIEAEATA